MAIMIEQDHIQPQKSLVAWGSSEYGAHGLGLGKDDISHPKTPVTLQGLDIAFMAAGAAHSVVVTEDQRVFAFGHGASGQLGCGSFVPHSEPVQIDSSSLPPNTTFAGVACGGRHSILWDKDGNCFCFGNNFDAQLSHEFSVTNFKENQPRPILLRSLQTLKLKVLRAAAGSRHSAFVTDSGLVLTCGLGMLGQLGHGSNNDENVARVVQKIEHGHVVADIACGENHTLALTERGSVFVWGSSKGCGSKKNLYSPMLVKGFGATDTATGNLQRERFEADANDPALECAVSIACGSNHCLILTESGKVYSFGNGSHGQLGLGHILYACEHPRLLIALVPHYIVQISAGEKFSAAITEEGHVWMWGTNSNMVFMDGYEGEKHLLPTMLKITNEQGIQIMSVACGNWHVLALRIGEIDGVDEKEIESNQTLCISGTKPSSSEETLKSNTSVSNQSRKGAVSRYFESTDTVSMVSISDSLKDKDSANNLDNGRDKDLGNVSSMKQDATSSSSESSLNLKDDSTRTRKGITYQVRRRRAPFIQMMATVVSNEKVFRSNESTEKVASSSGSIA